MLGMDYIQRTDTFIESLGFEAYRVGGSVRDEILGRKPKDADYVVRGVSLNDLYQTLLKKFVASACKAPSYIVLRNGLAAGVRVGVRGAGIIEIMLPRTEESTGPGRGDFNLSLDPGLPLIVDAKRRDFTFNALYKSVPDGRLVDPTGCGFHDLMHRFIRTTHSDSFLDDPLRTLRALRFVSTLGFDITSNTMLEMEQHAEAVTGLTAKGVSGTALSELEKLLLGPACARALRAARDTGVLAVLLPELGPMLFFDQGSRYHDLTTDEHTFKALETAAHVDANLRVRMALLFHDAGKPMVAWVGDDGRKHYYANGMSEDHEATGERLWRTAAERLNAPKKLREEVATLIRHHMVGVEGDAKAAKIRRMRVQLGDDMLHDLLLMRACDLTGKGTPVAAHLARVGAMEQLRLDAAKAGVPMKVTDLAVNGADMQALGIAGRDIGRVLRTLLDEVVCSSGGNRLNNREWLLKRAEALK